MKYSEIKEILKKHDKDTIKELIEEFDDDLVYEYYNQGYDLSSMQEAYQGKYHNDADFVKQLLEDCGDLPELPAYVYIDMDRTAEDVMMDYFEINGHYFRSM